MTSQKNRQRYNYLFLQRGTLPLALNGTYNTALEHRCNAVLLWPENTRPARHNTLLTDPCFTTKGFACAEQQLKRIHLQFHQIGAFFVTHRHFDHIPSFPHKKECIDLRKSSNDTFSGIDIIPCPGHSPDMRALAFRSPASENVWIVGDAVLNSKWLRAWKYYWPNFYMPDDIVQTWESLAIILSQAEIIIPGHGGVIRITAALLQALLRSFQAAEYAERCQTIVPLLQKRLQQFYE